MGGIRGMGSIIIVPQPIDTGFRPQEVKQTIIREQVIQPTVETHHKETVRVEESERLDSHLDGYQKDLAIMRKYMLGLLVFSLVNLVLAVFR